MESMQKILNIFEEKKELLTRRVNSGIEANRKGTAFLDFVDSAGNPVSDVHVKVKQKSHDFRFGANLFMLDEIPAAELNQEYKDRFAEVFNLATLPFYWDTLEPEQGKPRYGKDSPKIYRRPAPDLCLEYCESRGIEPKAHCLNYSCFVPDWLPRDTFAAKSFLVKRFRELAERYAHRIPSWEVINETFFPWEAQKFPFYSDPELVEWSFRTAEEFFPANKLIINENQRFIWKGEYFHFNRSPYYMQIERAMLKGARIDSVGMQYHAMFPSKEKAVEAGPAMLDPEFVYRVLDTYAMLGRPLQMTEVTFCSYSWKEEDEAVQAEILKNLYSMFFSHPAMEAIIYWNLADGYGFRAEPGDMTAGENFHHGGLLRYDMTPKAAYKVLHELVNKVWRTDLELESVQNKVSFNGFYGEYELEITGNGKTVTQNFHLGKNLPEHKTIIL